jgi:uncharacterized membrane protein
VVAASVGLTGFVVTVTVLVVQLATGTFSPRYMRLWYRDSVLKATLAVLVGALAFSFTLLRRIDENVPDLGVTLAGFLLGAGLVLFLVFLDRCLHRLRPVKVASLVAQAGKEALRQTVGLASMRRRSGADAELDKLLAQTPSLLVRSRKSGALQAIDDEGLLAWATHNDAVIVLRHGVGDFVSSNAVLLEVHGVDGRGTAAFPRVAEHRLAGRIALGTERTIEQDPAFALRILVDIAIRALSPAVNDPTTAVQVINHLEDTMALIGSTPGLDGRWEYRDDGDELRLVMPAHRFDDLVGLAFTEVRDYGRTSIQVLRRLRAALVELESSVLPEYVDSIASELARLDLTTSASFAETPDAALSALADRQGIGGPPTLTATIANHRPTL